MDDLSTKTALCVDNGLYTDWCLTIAPAFRRFMYWSPWQNAFPKSNNKLPGEGFDEMIRVVKLSKALKEADLVFFPDVYYGDFQEELVERGFRVWGAREGEIIELNRLTSKNICRKHGVTVSDAIGIRGIDALRIYLKSHDNVWIKTSGNRGDFETFKNDTYELSAEKLDELEYKLGAKKRIYEFVVEDDISPAVEWGIDAFTIDGQWPKRTFSGLEIKDKGFIGRVMEWDEIPQYLRDPNEKLSPWFQQKQYRGFYSTELRITDDGTSHLIDPCARLPSPPNEIQQMMFSNWPEIIWAGAAGEMIEPDAVHQYGVCAMIHSSWADSNWQSIKFPEEIRPYVKLRNHCRIEGVDYFVPVNQGLPEIGAVIGLGDSLEQAIEHCKENAEAIKGYYIDIQMDAIETALEERDKASALGIEI